MWHVCSLHIILAQAVSSRLLAMERMPKSALSVTLLALGPGPCAGRIPGIHWGPSPPPCPCRPSKSCCIGGLGWHSSPTAGELSGTGPPSGLCSPLQLAIMTFPSLSLINAIADCSRLPVKISPCILLQLFHFELSPLDWLRWNSLPCFLYLFH